MAVVDYPQQALLSLKNLHGPASDTLALQKMFAPYRVHSFEVLGGLISRLTGIEAVRVIHLGLAPLFGWLAPFAIARLLRLLAPRDWLIALLAVVIFYCIEGTASRGYANHAFVRMFNGKSVLLTIGVPLICAHGLRFGARPSVARFVLLALAQIAAVGLSSTALWLAPTLAMIAVAAGTPSLRRWPLRLAGSFASSAYVLALALWVMGQLGGGASRAGRRRFARRRRPSRARRRARAGAVRRDRRGDPGRARPAAHGDRAVRRGARGGGVRAERARVALCSRCSRSRSQPASAIRGLRA